LLLYPSKAGFTQVDGSGHLKLVFSDCLSLTFVPIQAWHTDMWVN